MASTGITSPKQIGNQKASALHASAVVSALVVHPVDQDGAYVSPGAGSTQVSIKEILTSSGASIMDSTNNSIGVTIRAGSAAGTEYTDGDTDSTPNGGAVFFMNGSNTMRVVSAATPLPVSGTFSASTQVAVSSVAGAVIMRSSAADALVTVYQSTASALQATVTPVAGSTWATRPIQSSAADLQVTATPAAGSTFNVRPVQSSAADLQATVTPVAGSTFNVRPVQSSQADLRCTVYQSSRSELLNTVYQSSRTEFLATVYQSSASEFQATVTPAAGSTFNVRATQSSAADLQATVTPVAGSTFNVRPIQSSQADLRCTVYQSSKTEFLNTVYQSTHTELKVDAFVVDSTGNYIESSTKAAGTNSTMRGLSVRSLMPPIATFASSNTFTSSAATIATSNAATIGYVFAYSITSTNQTPTKVAFYTGAGTLLWPVILAAISSAVTGVNLAVSPPAYLFKGTTGTALTLNIPSSGVGWKVGVSYWTE